MRYATVRICGIESDTPKDLVLATAGALRGWVEGEWGPLEINVFEEAEPNSLQPGPRLIQTFFVDKGIKIVRGKHAVKTVRR